MYCSSKVLNVDFDRAVSLVREALKQEGMGLMTEINLQTAFRQKLDRDFRPYLVLGACHPQVAFDMVQIDDKAPSCFPVVLQERQTGEVEVLAVDPFPQGKGDRPQCQRHDAKGNRSPVERFFTE